MQVKKILPGRECGLAIKKVFSILLLALFFILPALTPAVNGEYLRPVSAETPVVAEQVASGPETAAESNNYLIYNVKN
jgi:hypothetical protein